MIESTCLVTSLHLDQARMVKTPINYLLLIYCSIRSLVICKYRFKYVWDPFPHLKCEKGSECGIGMDCPALVINKHTLST